MHKKWWQSDWMVGGLTLLAFSAVWFFTAVPKWVEGRAYDAAMSWHTLPPSSQVAVIAIDQRSLDNLGRWPWSREVHARFLQQLQAAHPALIAYDLHFNEPQRDAGVDQLAKIKAKVDAAPDSYPAGFADEIKTILANLDVDQKLASSIQQNGKVVLPMLFAFGDEASAESDVPDYVARWDINYEGSDKNGLPISVKQPTFPLLTLGRASAGVAGEIVSPDADGVVRRLPMALRYTDMVLPSFAALVALKAQGLDSKQMHLELGRAMALGQIRIQTEADSMFRPHFYPTSAFSVDSFFDVQSGKISLDKYRGKIVVVGVTAPGLGSSMATPVDAATSPVIITASAISAILQQHFYVNPSWSTQLGLGVLVIVGLYLLLLLPRLRAAPAAWISALLLLGLIATEFLLLSHSQLWLPLMTPALLLVAGHLALTTKRFLVTEARHDAKSLESAESNRMLGLAFQQTGQLDMAFDKFRRVPLDDSMMEPLYNLALDFERKRQFNKAEAVFLYMAKHNPNYRDLPDKLKRAKALSETVILGGAGSSGHLILGSEGMEKPMLGRYQIERELGKGAMGVVYFGRDPKIGREVAIKTMVLSEEFEPAQIEEARSRFFREAEMAGRLSHPNIVMVYDAGEEHDLAYIAMEFLRGQNLDAWTQPEQLLPLAVVLHIVRDVAMALDYAHSNQVVHRDIKPANIMYDPEARKTKVTDFGVARITDASKTKTGMVLGTPAFMSPEQLAGKHIDGRSDLYSLGVALYQLATGKLPFNGDSMGELMYHITHDAPIDPRVHNPRLPAYFSALMMKAMQKESTARFQTGAQFAVAIAKLENALNSRPVAKTGGNDVPTE